MSQFEADYVIAGGGTAGCVLASRLAEASQSVILLEAGPDEHANALVQSVTAAPRLHHTELEWNYKTIEQPGLDGRRVYNCGGKLLSGSSAVNYGMWTRGDEADFNDWAKWTNDERWAYSRLLPYFRKVETHDGSGGDANQHGFSGPVHTISGNRKYPLRQKVFEALSATGHKDAADANSGQPVGIGLYTENWRNNARQPAGVVYSLDKVQVRTSSLVHKVLFSAASGFSPPRAIGVQLVSGEIFHARKETIIACGALKTPQVLMLSGVGAPHSLEKLGIFTVVPNPAIGANFHDHMSIIQFWRLRDEVSADGISAGHEAFNKRPEASMGIPIEFVTTASIPESKLAAAIVADAPLQAEAAKAGQPPVSNPLDPPGRAQVEFMFAYTVLGRGNPAFTAQVDGTHISSAVLLLLPSSRGSITLASRKPTDDPIINPNYFSTATDRALLREGVRNVLRTAEKLIKDGVIEREAPPAGYPALRSEKSSDEEIDARIRGFSATMYHPAGSVAMGAALDSELRVKGAEALRVVDASAFPGPVAGHPQHAVYALAERAADFILGRNAGA